jgi:membrane protein
VNPQQAKAAAVAQRIALRVWGALRAFGTGLIEHDALLVAPSMAFHFFLSLVPLLVSLGYLLGLFVRVKGVEAVIGPVLETAPEATQILVKRELERLAGSSVAPAPLAIVGFLWLASGGAHAFMDALERLYRAPRRGWLRKRALALGWVVLALIGLTASGWALVQWEDVARPAAEHQARSAMGRIEAGKAAVMAAASSATPAKESRWATREGRSTTRRPRPALRGSRLQQLGTSLVSAFIGTAMLAALYRFGVRRKKGDVSRVWPGAAMAVATWVLLSWGFGAYVTQLASYALFYGSLATMAVLLVWFWLTSLALLMGAELNAQLEGRRKAKGE